MFSYPIPPRNGKEQFASLDLLRVVASLMIVLFHAHSIAVKNAVKQGVHLFEAPQFWYSCVDLFFVMSGFLMIHMSRNLFGSSHGVKMFAIRRLTRTPPLYWIYTLMITAIFLIQPSLSAEGPIDLRTFLTSIFFIPNTRSPVIAIGWTLNYEIFFYCIIGLSIFLPYAKAWKAAIAALVVAVGIGYCFALPASPFGVWTNPLLLDFAIGILAAVVYYKNVALRNGGTLALFVLGIFFVLLLNPSWGIPEFFLFRALSAGLGMGLIVAAATWREKPLEFGRFTPVIRFFSEQTYTMYLCHILVLKILELVYYRFFHGYWAHIGFILLGAVITTLVSRVLYALIEKPLTEFLRLKIKKVTSRPVPVAASPG
jgi:peptidoglycan/LPS O-acetylase OafA/YrhL